MFNIAKFISAGIQNSLLLKNNTGFSFNGPWKSVYQDSVMDRWHVGDFTSAEYTISVEYDSKNREIIKCLVVGGVDQAKINVYSRLATNKPIVDIDAVVNDSYVDVRISPKSDKLQGVKMIFTAKYFHAQTQL